MTNDATQNPANRSARYSGAGTGGISQVIPTEAESRRGLRPFSLDDSASGARPIALGLTAVAGALLASAAVWRVRQPKDLPTRILHRVGVR